MTRTILAALAALVLTGCQVKAQTWHDYADDIFWSSRAMTEGGVRIRNTPRYRHYSSRYHHWHRHRERHRYAYRPRYPVGPQVHGYVARYESPGAYQKCGNAVSAVGTEHYSENEAKKAAIKAWMAEVRHRLGTEMMDVAHAKDVAFRCVVSTPGDRISDKVAKWTRGELLKECRLVAIPCRPDVDNTLPGDVGR